jgi:hypothetical protein
MLRGNPTLRCTPRKETLALDGPLGLSAHHLMSRNVTVASRHGWHTG